MSFEYILASVIIIILISGSLIFFIPAGDKKNIKYASDHSKNNSDRKKSRSDRTLTPSEREEMLDGVKNFTKNNPEKTAAMLRNWIDTEKKE